MPINGHYSAPPPNSHYSDWWHFEISARYARMRMAETFGINVRRVRLEQGLTLEVLAEEVGLAYSYVGEIERGRRNPTLDVVERIAAVLKTEPLELLRVQRSG